MLACILLFFYPGWIPLCVKRSEALEKRFVSRATVMGMCPIPGEHASMTRRFHRILLVER